MLRQSSPKRTRVVDSLALNPSIQRLCKHASSASWPSPLPHAPYQLLVAAAYATYGERNYSFMKETVQKVKEWSAKASTSLGRGYDKGIGDFPCRTFNLSPQSVSTPHTDQNNLAQGWCSITPLGTFDPAQGGHLVLWDFGLVIQFPPGSTALIPSALICHSNSTVQPGETRYSIVQYASGRIFRWVNNGNATDAEWFAKATPQAIEERKREQAQRWKNAAASYFTLDEFLEPENGQA